MSHYQEVAYCRSCGATLAPEEGPYCEACCAKPEYVEGFGVVGPGEEWHD